MRTPKLFTDDAFIVAWGKRRWVSNRYFIVKTTVEQAGKLVPGSNGRAGRYLRVGRANKYKLAPKAKPNVTLEKLAKLFPTPEDALIDCWPMDLFGDNSAISLQGTKDFPYPCWVWETENGDHRAIDCRWLDPIMWAWGTEFDRVQMLDDKDPIYFTVNNEIVAAVIPYARRRNSEITCMGQGG